MSVQAKLGELLTLWSKFSKCLNLLELHRNFEFLTTQLTIGNGTNLTFMLFCLRRNSACAEFSCSGTNFYAPLSSLMKRAFFRWRRTIL